MNLDKSKKILTSVQLLLCNHEFKQLYDSLGGHAQLNNYRKTKLWKFYAVCWIMLFATNLVFGGSCREDDHVAVI